MKKRNSTKSALIASIVMLCLSFTMLIGTTFAWFTDSVTSSGNVIQTGNFDVGMYWAEGNENPADTKWTDASLGAIFYNRYWEPGYAESKHLKIANEGTLALKYQLAIIPHGEISKLADVIDVYYITPAKQLTTRNDFTAADKIGTLADLIETGIATGTLLEGESYNATIVLKMQETANSDYENLSIGTDFSIQLVATQVTAEEDTWDDQYDADAFKVVSNTAELKTAIANAVDTTTIFLKDGTYYGSHVEIKDKNISLIGLGQVNFIQDSSHHLFVIYESDVLIKNVNMDCAGIYRNGIYVRDNSNVILENCTVKNSGSYDVIIDEASEAEENKVSTTSTVRLINSHIEDAAMCASPVTSVPGATWDNYAYLNFNDGKSTVGYVEIQGINIKPENCYINDSNIHNRYNFYAHDDASLKKALDTINSNSKYWNTEVIVNLAAGEYSGDHVINQYPTWNGNIGGGSSANNLGNTGGVADHTNIKFVGAKAVTRSTDPAVVFTGNVTVNGFGYAGGAFGFHYASTEFVNVAFDAQNSVEANGKDKIALYLKSAANDVFFNNCTFKNATHVTLGGSGNDAIGAVEFNDCKFNNGGCLSGYFETLTVTDANVTLADKGFINAQHGCTITVDNSTVNAAEYFLRTRGSANMTVTGTDITLYEVDGVATNLVNFRGSNESAKFIDCTLPVTYTVAGVDFDSALYVNNKTYIFEDAQGFDYYYNSDNEVILYNVTGFTGEDLVIPEGVDIIGNKAVNGMTNIKSVTIPSSVKEIGYSVFNGCTSLESIVIPAGVTLNARTDGKSNTNTFAGCTSLTSVTIEEGFTTIPDTCFVNCTALESVVIPSTVTSLGRRAFYDCLKLETVFLMSEDCTFGEEVFGSNRTGLFGDMTIYVVSEEMKAKVEASLGTNQKPNITVKVMGSVESDEETIFVTNDAELRAALEGLSAKKTTIYLQAGTYADDINITVAELGAAIEGSSIIFKGVNDTGVIFAGKTTLGLYQKGTTNVARYAANFTFENIVFQHKNPGTDDSVSVQNIGINGNATDVDSIVFKNCTIINNGEYGIAGVSGGCAYNARVIDCKFINAGFQPHGNFGTGLLVEGCTFENSMINVQAGNGVTVKNCNFTNTVTDTHNNDGFYFIRSNNTPVTVIGGTYDVDSTVTGTGVAGPKGWGVFVNRGSTANWSVTDAKITMTDAALKQTALKVAATTSTGKVVMVNVTVNGVYYVSNTAELEKAIEAGVTEIGIDDGEYNFTSKAQGKTFTVTALRDNAVINVIPSGQSEAGGQLDYSLDSSKVTFNGVTIKTNSQLYAGFCRLSAVYNNCTIQNTYNLGAGTSEFNNCTFNITNEYLRVGGATKATFNKCTFNTIGRAILVYQDGTNVDQEVNVVDCIFNASEKATTYTGIHVAAVSIDGTNGKYTVNLNGYNEVNGEFNGLWQIKTGEANVKVFENGAML